MRGVERSGVVFQQIPCVRPMPLRLEHIHTVLIFSVPYTWHMSKMALVSPLEAGPAGKAPLLHVWML